MQRTSLFGVFCYILHSLTDVTCCVTVCYLTTIGGVVDDLGNRE